MGAFQLSLAVLVRYRSQTLYLGLEVSPPMFLCDNQRMVLWHSRNRPLSLSLRAFHPLWSAVPGDFGLLLQGRALGPNTTSRPRCRG